MDVTSLNLHTVYGEIKLKLQNASFISMDSEFSGLLSSQSLKNSLFDDSSARYKKLRENIEHLIIIQFGLSIFEYKRDKNAYEASVYRFHICPLNFINVDKFVFQSSSIEFLCEYNFDFNKFAYEGLPYFNHQQEEFCNNALKNGELPNNFFGNFLNMGHKTVLQDECDRISLWSVNSHVGDTITLKPTWCYRKNPALNLILQRIIRQRFPDIWTRNCDDGIIVEKITMDDEKYNKSGTKSLDHEIIKAYRGFSSIFELIVSAKKPIIGHNMLLDLMMMYNQFFKPLPGKYKAFKENILELFPLVYDTKYISYMLQKQLEKSDCWKQNGLSELYAFFKSQKKIFVKLCFPSVKLNFMNDNDIQFHDAAFDSYVAGFCFIMLAHYCAILSYNKDWIPRSLSSVEHFNAVISYKNHINIIWANISSVNLEGDDPVLTRPLLYVEDKTGNININMLNDRLARYGSFESYVWSKNSAIVVISNPHGARGIINDFKKDRTFDVSQCSGVRYSLKSSVILFSGVTSILFALLYYKRRYS